MTQSTQRVIVVDPPAALVSRPRLFAALSAAFPVRFEPAEADGSDAADGIIRVGPVQGFVRDPPVPTVRFTGSAHGSDRTEAVGLVDHPVLDRRVRGLTLASQPAGTSVTVANGTAVLAEAGGEARWSVLLGESPAHEVGVDLPELDCTETLLRALLERHSVALVALIHLLRGVCAADDFELPPLRAAIIFDDPNVRRPSYGCIDYEHLVAHADAHGYHAAMAMVPLDAGSSHAATVSLFKRRRDRLSLVFHGNDHVKRELIRLHDRASALSVCAQATRRVARFEARTGLRVDRVMTPPHGMCSPSVVWALSALGFDALCAIHPEPWSERPAGDPLLAGWDPASFAGPTAVLPRFPLSCSQAEIALRALIGNPLILYGHHNDLLDGLGPLEQAAARVNALGEVQWMSLSEIALTNVATRVEAGAVIARPYAARTVVEVAPRAPALSVERPRNSSADLTGWSIGSSDQAAFGDRVPAPARDQTELRLLPRTRIEPSAVAMPSWRPWPPLRRRVSEARDRAMPLQARAMQWTGRPGR